MGKYKTKLKSGAKTAPPEGMIIPGFKILDTTITQVHSPLLVEPSGLEYLVSDNDEIKCVINGKKWNWDQEEYGWSDGVYVAALFRDGDDMYFGVFDPEQDYEIVPGYFTVTLTGTLAVPFVKLQAKEVFTAYGYFGEVYAPGYNQVFDCEEEFANELVECGRAVPYTLITPEGTILIGENGTGIDVAQYQYADVNAGIVPTGKKIITANGTDIDVTNYASVDVSVPSVEPRFTELTVWNATSVAMNVFVPDAYVTGLAKLTKVTVPAGETLVTHGYGDSQWVYGYFYVQSDYYDTAKTFTYSVTGSGYTTVSTVFKNDERPHTGYSNYYHDALVYVRQSNNASGTHGFKITES